MHIIKASPKYSTGYILDSLWCAIYKLLLRLMFMWQWGFLWGSSYRQSKLSPLLSLLGESNSLILLCVDFLGNCSQENSDDFIPEKCFHMVTSGQCVSLCVCVHLWCTHMVLFLPQSQLFQKQWTIIFTTATGLTADWVFKLGSVCRLKAGFQHSATTDVSSLWSPHSQGCQCTIIMSFKINTSYMV